MFALKLFELFFTILWLAFMLSEIVIPMAKQSPMFPSFRKNEVTKTKKKE